MKFMLNEQELEEHLTKEMVAPTEAQPLRDHTAYQKWNQKDRSARYTLLSSLQNDLIGQYDELPTCKALWEQLKFSFGRTSTTRLRSLVIKFEEYTKDPKHTMSEHLRVMSNMIGKLRDAGHALTDEQQVRAVIRSLPASWANMKQILTHSENIKNFSDVSQHVILEAETRDADKTLTYVAQEGSRNANGKRGRQSATKHVARDREGFVDYHRIPVGSKHIFMGNNSSEEVLGVGSYQLKLRTGRTLILDDVRYAPTVRLNLLSVIALLDSGFSFIFRGNKLDIFLDDVLFGHGFRMDSLFFQLDLIDSQSSYSYVVNDNIMNDSTTWHARLGHIGQDRMTRLAREGLLGPLAKVNLQTCEACLAESDFPSIGDASKNLDLYELEEVEPTLPSPSEGGELVPHPVVAEDSVSDLQPSGSIPDSGSTPQGPLGQQDSQLRRAALDFVKDPKYHGKAKHIGLRYHFIRTLVAQGEVSMKHIPTGRMVADPLTKPIARDVFLSHIRSMGLRRHYESDWAEKLRLCHEEDTQCRYFSMYPWIMDDAVSRGMSRKAVGSNWNDMRALGRKFNITPCCVIHSPGDFVDFRFDMSHEYITYERFNTAHYEGFESV
ncbi:hypothetical protein RJ640_014577 [Escallonia rubra]|uniref:GAG-pre-integrase domain-containing protein n=1 Tax=Escallonia rubra TaxID=112253 RepID=A0AA88R048_9ASTE|nr:hypothetical protein RJ640_014577 [Escallonia rubra]